MKNIGKGGFKKFNELNWEEMVRKKKTSLYNQNYIEVYKIYTFIWTFLNCPILFFVI